MNKKALLSIVLLLIVFVTKSQTNIQTHYEFGSNKNIRNYSLLTIENLSIDKYGSTYFFVDMNTTNISNFKSENTYFEFSRDFSIGNNYFTHLEYNGGHGYINDSISSAFLLGFTYLYENTVKNFSLSLTPMYKCNFELQNNKHAFQVTIVWNWIISQKLSFNGFVDLWQYSDFVILLTEPIIWYNINDKLSIGSEVEISHNYIPFTVGMVICPTIALKYTL